MRQSDSLEDYLAALRRVNGEPAMTRTAPPLGLFVTKSWLQLLEQMLTAGRFAEARHMVGAKQTEPMRMPRLSEWPA